MPKTLSRLESVANFTEFVKAFSVFGAEMVELAHVTCKFEQDFFFYFQCDLPCNTIISERIQKVIDKMIQKMNEENRKWPPLDLS